MEEDIRIHIQDHQLLRTTLDQKELTTALRGIRSVLEKHVGQTTGLQQSEMVALLLTVSRNLLAQSELVFSDERLFQHVEKSISSRIGACVEQPDAVVFAKMIPLAEKLQKHADTLGRFALAYIYQLASMPSRRIAQDSLQSANKQNSLQKTISFTQLYTPPWVVQYLVARTTVDSCKSTESTIHRAELHSAECRGSVTMGRGRGSVRTTIIDPACGAGNFLVEAFAQLYPRMIAQGYSAAEATQILCQQSLFGCDIDPLGLWVCALALTTLVLPMCEDVQQFQLTCTAAQSGDIDSLGSLSANFAEDHPLCQKYDAVIGNPPYLGRKLLDRQLKKELRQHYPQGHQDLCTAFLIKGLALLKDGGRLGYITQSSLLFLPTYEGLRRLLLEHRVLTVVEAGTQVFPLQAGEKVKSILLVVERADPENHTSIFIDVTNTPLKQQQLSQVALSVSQEHVYPCLQKNFHLSRKLAFNYKSPPVFQECLQTAQRLAEWADVRQGLATGDNARFVKWWWQIAPSEREGRWVPYAKSGGSERWFAPISSILDWQNNGQQIKQAVAERYPYLNGNVNWVVKNEQFYFRAGLTFSLVSTKQLSVRDLPAGCIFDVAGSSVFPVDESEKYFLLGYLNSSFVAACANSLNPTINFQVGDIKALPVIEINSATREKITSLALSCLEIKKATHTLGDAFEGDPDWLDSIINASDAEAAARQTLNSLTKGIVRLPNIETEIDALVLLAGKSQYGDRFETMTESCNRVAQERKIATAPVQDLPTFARLIIRRLCYSNVHKDIKLTEFDVGKTLNCPATTKAWLEKTIGCSLFFYLQNEFVREQKMHLFNTVRLSVVWDSNQNQLVIEPDYQTSAIRV